MWGFLLNLAGWLSKDVFVQQLVHTLIDDLKQAGQKMLPVVVDAIKKAAVDKALSGPEKMKSVLATVQTQFPDVEKSVVDSTVALAYRTLKVDPKVPEVQ